MSRFIMKRIAKSCIGESLSVLVSGIFPHTILVLALEQPRDNLVAFHQVRRVHEVHGHHAPVGAADANVLGGAVLERVFFLRRGAERRYKVEGAEVNNAGREDSSKNTSHRNTF